MLVEAINRTETAAKTTLAAFNAGGASSDELRKMLAVSKRIAAVITTLQTAASSAIAKTERHGDGGTEILAETTGLSRREARGQVKTAETLAVVPSVRDAVSQGRVSQANAKRLADAVKRTSATAVEADGRLLRAAESMRAEQFTKEARRWIADQQSDGGEADYQRMRAKRCVRVWNSDNGVVELHGTFDPLTGQRISNRLQAEARRLYQNDKKQAAEHDRHCANSATGNKHADRPDGTRGSERHGRDGRRTFEQCMADALDNLTSNTASAINGHTDTGTDTGTASTSQPSQHLRGSFADICVVAHVDETTGELVGQLADGQRLPASVMAQLSCNARFVAVLCNSRGQSIWRTHATRTATEPQRRLLLAHWGGCFHCGANPAMCEIHHIVPVSQGGETKIDNMVPVCWDCHKRIHQNHWQVHKHRDGNHTLHPPDRHHHGPARAPDQPLLFAQADHNNPGPSPPPNSAFELGTDLDFV